MLKRPLVTIGVALVTVFAADMATNSVAAADFATRCAAEGVVKCVGFDSPADISGRWGDPSGITVDGASIPTIDGEVKASGAGSIKFTVPSNSGSDTSGSYFTNFSDDLSVQFGERSEFFVQWRQRFSQEFLDTHYRGGGGGIKQAIVTTGDQPGRLYASCEATEVAVQTYYQDRFPILYQSCTGSASHGPFDPFYEPVGASDYKLQNARPSPFCLYSQEGDGHFPPAGNCIGWLANEWMTFQLRIQTGPRVGDEFVESYVDLWIAREGQPSQHAIRWGPYNLSAGDVAEDQRYGKVWLLPYQTNKDPSQAHPTAYTWYDELIVSRVKIADPTGSEPPSPPTGGATPGWSTLANTKIDLISACGVPKGSGPFPEVCGVEGTPAILSWSGGAFDTSRNRLIVWGGGHNAYYGNELYALDLDTRAMTRLNDPGLPLDDCNVAIANGTQPASRHTYDGIEYMPNVDRLFVFGGGIACAAGGGTQDTWTFDFATMAWQRMNPRGPIPSFYPGARAAYDPNTGLMYLHDGFNLFSYDFGNDAYTQLSFGSHNYLGVSQSATVDPVRKKFVFVGWNNDVGAGRVYAYDIGPTSTYELQTLATTGGEPIVASSYPGLDYDPVSGRIVAWNGGNTVYSLNLDTLQWTPITYPGGPGAASPEQGRGTHGRWRYSAAANAFVLVNDTHQDGFIFRLP